MKKITTSATKVKAKKERKRRKRPSNLYRVRNWATYNKALKQRGSLSLWFSQEAIEQWYYKGLPKRGGQFTYSDLAIETALTIKAVYHLGLRQTEGMIQSLVELLGLELDIPDYTTICRRQGELKITLPVQSCHKPLHLVVDSTGLKVFGEGEWKVRQHGYSKRRTWRKLHLGVDEASGEIQASELSTNQVDDASCAKILLDQIKPPLSTFGGDGGYDKNKVYDLLAHRPKQADPVKAVIAPRHDAKIKQHGNCANKPLPRDENIRAIRKLGRKRWKEQSGYHRRSIAETAMSRYKLIIGPMLKARDFQRQKVEAKTGCAILNRMAHLGMPDSYKVEFAL